MKTVLRFFMTSAASILVFSGAVQADNHEGSMHSVTGELRTRYEANDNIGLTDSKLEDGFYNRARINFDIMPSDNLKIRITPQAQHVWSTNGTNGTQAVNLFLKEGWMAWMPSDAISLFIGRQVLSYGNGSVIGARDWDQFAETAFDAARARFTFDMGDVDLFWSKLNDGGVSTATSAIGVGQGDADLLAIYAALDLEDMVAFISALDLYGYAWFDNNDTADNKAYVLGARADGNFGVVDYNVEGTALFGELAGQDSQKGFQAEVEVGSTFMDKHRVAVEILYANSEYNNLLGDYHQYLGASDILARRNILSFALMADLQPTDQIDIGAHGFLFMRPNKDVGVAVTPASGTTNTAINTTTETGRLSGFELDGYVGYQPEDNLKFTAGYNGFFASGYLSDAENLSEFYVQGKMTF